MSNLAVRLATAAVVVPVVLAGLYYLPPVATFVTALCMTVCAAYEVLGLYGHGKRTVVRILGSALGGAIVAAGYLMGSGAGSMIIIITALTMISLSLGLMGNDETELAGRKMTGLLVASVYPGLFFLLLCLMRRDVPHGPGWIVLSLKTAFFSDTGAYFAGRFLGKHKLSPRISPAKTVEGAVGGLAAGLLSGLLAHLIYLPSLTLPEALALGFAGSAVGQVGDLVVSLLKRASKTKDTGLFFPGHGGIMDRMDGAVFVTGLVWLYLSVRGIA